MTPQPEVGTGDRAIVEAIKFLYVATKTSRGCIIQTTWFVPRPYVYRRFWLEREPCIYCVYLLNAVTFGNSTTVSADKLNTKFLLKF
jgi:hypothetical protein